MNVKSLIQKLGISKQKVVRKNPIAQERERFEEDVKEQFKKLKDKGLSIPVFTL